jgi:hypothetical protein
MLIRIPNPEFNFSLLLTVLLAKIYLYLEKGTCLSLRSHCFFLRFGLKPFILIFCDFTLQYVVRH